MNSLPFPKDPRWGQFCAELVCDLVRITPEDIESFREKCLEALRPDIDRMPLERQKMLAALSSRSKSELREVGNYSGEPEAFPDIKNDLNIVLNGIED